MRTRLLAATTVLATLAATATANAGAFGIREQSAVGLGMEFAGAASGAAGLSSMYWNPATITMAPGHTGEYNATFIHVDATITPVPPTPTASFGSSGNIGQDAIVPATFTAYQITDQIWLGLSSTAPFGLVTKPNDAWAGQVYGRSSRITTLNFNPIIGYKVTDWLSIAGGPVIQYFDTTLKQATGVLPNAGNVILKGDDVGFGATAGVTITPFQGTAIGVGYRSTIHHDIAGSLRTPFAFIPATVNLNLPEMVTFGITQAVTAQLKVDFGFEFTNWSRVKTPGIVSDNSGLPVSRLALNYKDGYFYSIGAEYQWDPRWAFRVGLGYEQSPIDFSNRTVRLPDTDRIHAGLGATYRYSEKIAFSVAYSHIFRVGSRNGISILPGNPQFAGVGLPFVATTDTSADIVSVSLNYRWDDPAVAIPAPLIRKY